MLKSHSANYKILCLVSHDKQSPHGTKGRFFRWSEAFVWSTQESGLTKKKNKLANQAPACLSQTRQTQLISPPLLFQLRLLSRFVSFFFPPLHHIKGQTPSGTSVIGLGVKSAIKVHRSCTSCLSTQHDVFTSKQGSMLHFINTYQHIVQSCWALRPQQQWSSATQQDAWTAHHRRLALLFQISIFHSAVTMIRCAVRRPAAIISLNVCSSVASIQSSAAHLKCGEKTWENQKKT